MTSICSAHKERTADERGDELLLGKGPVAAAQVERLEAPQHLGAFPVQAGALMLRARSSEENRRRVSGSGKSRACSHTAPRGFVLSERALRKNITYANKNA
jgi:hypothetical protein